MTTEHHGLDTDDRVCFYEQDFYVLSNFSSFSLRWCGHVFPTTEHAYHWEKFRHPVDGESDNHRVQRNSLASYMISAESAHEAFTTANRWKAYRRADWDEVKVEIMRGILRAKADQHEYVRRKLLATGDRELVENSWRDDYWGWGPNRDGLNMLGKLWMEIRAELRDREESGALSHQQPSGLMQEHAVPIAQAQACGCHEIQGLTEEQATLINQGIDLLMEMSRSQANAGNCSESKGAEASADAIFKLAALHLRRVS